MPTQSGERSASATPTGQGGSRSADHFVAPSLASFTPQGDNELARELIRQIAVHRWDTTGEMLGRVYQVIVRHNPDTCITPRRVRAFWYKEAAGVRYHEMIELAEVARVVSN